MVAGEQLLPRRRLEITQVIILSFHFELENQDLRRIQYIFLGELELSRTLRLEHSQQILREFAFGPTYRRAQRRGLSRFSIDCDLGVLFLPVFITDFRRDSTLLHLITEFVILVPDSLFITNNIWKSARKKQSKLAYCFQCGSFSLSLGQAFTIRGERRPVVAGATSVCLGVLLTSNG